MSDITKEQVIEWLSAQPVKDMVALVKELEELWGVSAAPVAVAGAAGAAAAPAEEKTEFDVILKDKGASAINVIKEGCSKDEAKEIEAKLKAAGATVEIK